MFEQTHPWIVIAKRDNIWIGQVVAAKDQRPEWMWGGNSTDHIVYQLPWEPTGRREAQYKCHFKTCQPMLSSFWRFLDNALPLIHTVLWHNYKPWQALDLWLPCSSYQFRMLPPRILTVLCSSLPFHWFFTTVPFRVDELWPLMLTSSPPPLVRKSLEVCGKVIL